MAENNARAKRKIKTRMNKFCEEYNAQTGSIISSKITPRLPLGREQGEDFDPLPLPTSEVLYEEDSYETENNGCTERLDTLTLECDELQEYSEELDEKVLGSVIGKFTTHASDLYTFSEEEKEVNIMSIEEEEFEKDLNNFRPHQNTNIHGLHVGDVHLPPLDTEGNELIDDTPLLSPVASSINFPNLVKSSTSQQQGGVASVHHIAMQEIRANINIFLEWGEAKNRLLQDYKQTENKDFKTMFAYNEFSMSDFNTFDIHGIQAEKFTYAGWSHRPVTLHMNYPEKKIFWRRKRQHFFNHCGTIDITKINGFLLGLQSYTFRKRFLPEEIEKIGTLPLLIPYECVSFVGETRTYDFVIPNHEQKIKFLLAIISLLRDKQEKSNKKKEKIKQIELPSYYDILILQIKLKIEYIAMLAKKNKCLLFMTAILKTLETYDYPKLLQRKIKHMINSKTEKKISKGHSYSHSHYCRMNARGKRNSIHDSLIVQKLIQKEEKKKKKSTMKDQIDPEYQGVKKMLVIKKMLNLIEISNSRKNN